MILKAVFMFHVSQKFLYVEESSEYSIVECAGCIYMHPADSSYA